MVTTDPDGGTHYDEYAVILPSGLRVGPMCETEAHRTTRERGGTVLKRTVTRSAWGNA